VPPEAAVPRVQRFPVLRLDPVDWDHLRALFGQENPEHKPGVVDEPGKATPPNLRKVFEEDGNDEPGSRRVLILINLLRKEQILEIPSGGIEKIKELPPVCNPGADKKGCQISRAIDPANDLEISDPGLAHLSQPSDPLTLRVVYRASEI
jgi:hypothetical protein